MLHLQFSDGTWKAVEYVGRNSALKITVTFI